MDISVVLCLLTFIYGTHAEQEEMCTPGTKVPHPNNCSMYYICDNDGNQIMFLCPVDLLYNSMTSNCVLAENVTCFGSKWKVETTVTDEFSGKDNKRKEGEESVDKTGHGKDPDYQKELYSLEYSYETPSEIEEFDVTSQDRIRPTAITLENENFGFVKSKINDHNKETTYKNHDIILNESLGKPLEEEAPDDEENDKHNPAFTVDTHYPFKPELRKKDYEYITPEVDLTKSSHSYSPDSDVHVPSGGRSPSDSYGNETDKVKKREVIDKESLPEGDGSDVEENTENFKRKNKNENEKTVAHDGNLHMPDDEVHLKTLTPTKNSEAVKVTETTGKETLSKEGDGSDTEAKTEVVREKIDYEGKEMKTKVGSFKTSDDPAVLKNLPSIKNTEVSEITGTKEKESFVREEEDGSDTKEKTEDVNDEFQDGMIEMATKGEKLSTTEIPVDLKHLPSIINTETYAIPETKGTKTLLDEGNGSDAEEKTEDVNDEVQDEMKKLTTKGERLNIPEVPVDSKVLLSATTSEEYKITEAKENENLLKEEKTEDVNEEVQDEMTEMPTKDEKLNTTEAPVDSKVLPSVTKSEVYKITETEEKETLLKEGEGSDGEERTEDTNEMIQDKTVDMATKAKNVNVPELPGDLKVMPSLKVNKVSETIGISGKETVAKVGEDSRAKDENEDVKGKIQVGIKDIATKGEQLNILGVPVDLNVMPAIKNSEAGLHEITESSGKETISEMDGSDAEEKTKDIKENVQDKIKEIATQGEKLHVPKLPIDLQSLPLPTNSDIYKITKAKDTNILRLKWLTEPIGNWSEHIKNGWTDLKLFWKHPIDKDIQGKLNLGYPADSMSSEYEIKDLLLKMLDLGADIDENSEDEVVEEDTHVDSDKVVP